MPDPASCPLQEPRRAGAGLETARRVEALVTAAREYYQGAIAAAESVGRRLDAARGLEPGTGEAFLLKQAYVPQGLQVDGNFERLLEIYDSSQRPQVHRGSAASPLGFWAGDA